MRAPGWLRLARLVPIVLFGIMFLCTAELWLLGELTPEIVSSWSLILPIAAAVVGLYLLSYYAYLPWNARRIFNQQKEYSAPFEIELTPEAMLAFSQYGYSSRPWGEFHKWREDERLLLLYLSDVLYIVIPKRFLDEQQAAQIRALLREHEVIDANRPSLGGYSRYMLWISLAVLLLAVLVALYLGFRQPLR